MENVQRKIEQGNVGTWKSPQRENKLPEITRPFEQRRTEENVEKLSQESNTRTIPEEFEGGKKWSESGEFQEDFVEETEEERIQREKEEEEERATWQKWCPQVEGRYNSHYKTVEMALPVVQAARALLTNQNESL